MEAPIRPAPKPGMNSYDPVLTQKSARWPSPLAWGSKLSIGCPVAGADVVDLDEVLRLNDATCDILETGIGFAQGVQLALNILFRDEAPPFGQADALVGRQLELGRHIDGHIEGKRLPDWAVGSLASITATGSSFSWITASRYPFGIS